MSDPLEFVHRYKDPWDQECVALLGAVLAYGNVKQIRKSVQAALDRMQAACPGGPAAFVRALGAESASAGSAVGKESPAKDPFKGWIHRFNQGRDLTLLFKALARSWKEHGSLGAHFLSHLDPKAVHVGPALDALMKDWKRWEPGLGRGSASYLLTAPKDGSCCKRWCMFLRWMGRRDLLDPGLWTAASPLATGFPEGKALRSEQLVIPLDTHTGRISQYLGLTKRKSLNWKAAVEVTQRLKLCDPSDPTKYDFALARLGILDLCQKKFRVEICERCSLLPVCQFAQKRKKRLRSPTRSTPS